jgi:Leucine-rich repeat (LRR) protein
MSADSEKPTISFKFGSPDEAYRAARRRIVNNALRRKQRSLDLSNFGLAELPAEIGLLHFLQELNISNNQLVNLPFEIGNLKSLAKLDARVNKLVDLPISIGELENLRVLFLQRNKIRTSHHFFLRRWLSLRSTHLTDLRLPEIPRWSRQQPDSRLRIQPIKSIPRRCQADRSRAQILRAD